MEIQGKVWGFTSPLFAKNNVAINYIELDKGGFCSKHKHIKKYNMFFVISGKLKVEIWKDYGLVDTTTLIKNTSTIVKPGEFHKFSVLEKNTKALEIYWTELQEDDIIRENVGGTEP
jgi:mannose-6-phosphate isomerase-like protein (cupin superfamily)